MNAFDGLSAEWELIYAPYDLRNEIGKYLKGKRTNGADEA